MKSRKWAPIDEAIATGGTTWIELFAAFAISGARSQNGDHIKDEEASKRANARSSKTTKRGEGKDTQDVTVKATFGEELTMFKAIVRNIAKHEIRGSQADIFGMETRQHHTRLAGLAVYGHQPAIAGFLQVKEQEKDDITKAILSQKAGSNPETIKSFEELRNRQRQEGEESQTTRIKIAKIVTGATVRWKRIKSKEVQAELKASKKIGPQYKSRLIACTQCGEEQETKTMQLRTTQGFRGIHCRRCGLHERCLHNECSCKEVWHRCAVHGIDPFVHQSRRGV